MAQVITLSTWLLTRFSITVQRLKGLLWGCALSTRYRRHAVVLLAGICSNYQFKGIPPIRKNSAHHKIKKTYNIFFRPFDASNLYKLTRIRILQYNFSDPQASKDICDRRRATLKNHMRRFIKEGND